MLVLECDQALTEVSFKNLVTIIKDNAISKDNRLTDSLAKMQPTKYFFDLA